MYMKQTTGILWAFLLCLAGLATQAQSKDCKFDKAKDAKGNAIQVIAIPTKVGKISIRKTDGKFFMNYSTKAIIITMHIGEDLTELRVDSVAFYFGTEKVTFPAIGKGDIKNENKLKNTFEYLSFEIALDEAMVAKMTAAKVDEFFVYGEKQAGYRDVMTEKSQDKLMNAFSCF